MAENSPTYYSKNFQATETIYGPVFIRMTCMQTVYIIYAYSYNRKKKNQPSTVAYFLFPFPNIFFLLVYVSSYCLRSLQEHFRKR